MKENLKNKINKATTPAMKQFWESKSKHPDSIMLFRMGDFYETFDKDAIIASNILGIALTKRANGSASAVPLAGFPYHSLDQYLHKLLKSGYKVAICEQVEDPKLAKGIVKREVVEILSPGAAISDKFLNHRENNFLCGIYIENESIGYSILDYSTGDFFTGNTQLSNLKNITTKFQIKEIIISDEQNHILKNFNLENIYVSNYSDWIANESTCYNELIKHFKVRSLKGFGLDNNKLAIISSGITLHYIKNNFFGRIKHITSISKIIDSDYMMLDSFTIKNLEIFKSLSNQNTKGTLLDSIDNTVSAMGSRMLKSHLLKPLINKIEINKRLSYIDELISNKKDIKSICKTMENISDIQRIISKVSTNKANPRDLINLSTSLQSIPDLLKTIDSKKILSLLKKSKKLNKLIKMINSHIIDNPPININKGEYIKSNISKELDELRILSNDANNWLVKYQQNEKEKTGISNLKIGYNKVFGYYIDITKTHLSKVPDYYFRKQTLTNSERYFTEELKKYEIKILSSQDRKLKIELSIFNNILLSIVDKIKDIQTNALIIADLDVILSHTITAKKNNYVRPLISNKSNSIKLKKSRHPVVEQLLEAGNNFISNDIDLNCKNNQLAIITGPNMSGKSTFLRQIGLISILAQIGSYVPAKKANLSVIDQLFTRVGASDNLSGGESTFLVEMNEAANILNNATPNSLIILDEVGRGTSSFDGLSLAWSIVEYIHNNKKIKAKTLFATHYHELINLAEELPDAFNLNIHVKEENDNIYFIRKIKHGGASKSYGINVAQMAGIPSYVLKRAKELLKIFTSENKNIKLNVEKDKIDIKQVELFNLKDEFLDEIKNINIDNFTPIEALNILSKIKKKLK